MGGRRVFFLVQCCKALGYVSVFHGSAALLQPIILSHRQITADPSGRPVVGDLFTSFDFGRLPDIVNIPTHERLCAFVCDDLKRPELAPAKRTVRGVVEDIKKINTSNTLCWVLAKELRGSSEGQDGGLGDFGSAQRVFAHCAKAVADKVEAAAAEQRADTPRERVATTSYGLGQWLRALQLDEFESILRQIGAVDAQDVRDGFACGHITQEMLEAEGLKPLRVMRLRREASKVGVDSEVRKARLRPAQVGPAGWATD